MGDGGLKDGYSVSDKVLENNEEKRGEKINCFGRKMGMYEE
jgi:hypothetical protein